jgi:SAM-dependent methyltransferase
MDACRICGEATGTPTATVTAARATSTWVKCAGCGVEHIDPYPDQQALAAYYDDGYAGNDNYSAAGFEVGLAHRYSPEYREAVHGEFRQSMADLGVDLQGNERVLDFGCAEGIYLDYLAGLGHSTASLTGVDISPQMVEVVKSKGYAGFTIDEALPVGEYDLITLWDVIEHVPSPPDTFAQLAKALAPEGKILLETPRVGLLSEIMVERFEHYLPIEHLHLFTREALVGTAERAGLTVVAARSFGANAPAARIPAPFKQAFDALAKATDNGATQIMLLGLS